MSSYTIPTDWTTEDLMEALLPPESALIQLGRDFNYPNISNDTGAWLIRIQAIRQSQQAKPAQPELLHVAERKAY